MSNVPLSLKCMTTAAALAALGGCGTPYATVAAGDGRPVMLLGHDPVAYFTEGRPQRGQPQWRADLPGRSYYFSSAQNLARFQAEPARYEPQYGGFCASGAAFAVKLGSDPTAWTLRNGRLFIFGDEVGQAAWSLEPDWNIRHADALWPGIREAGWRVQSLRAYVDKVPHYKSGADIRAQWARERPGQPFPAYDPGGMVMNLLLKPPGWRAAEGFGQPPLGYPP